MKKQGEKLQGQIMHRPLLHRKKGGVRVRNQRGVVASQDVDHRPRKKSGKCFHCGKEDHIKKNCFALKEKKEANNEKKNDTNTTATLDNEVVILTSEDEKCLSVADD